MENFLAYFISSSNTDRKNIVLVLDCWNKISVHKGGAKLKGKVFGEFLARSTWVEYDSLDDKRLSRSGSSHFMVSTNMAE